jgi:hypothetical protein
MQLLTLLSVLGTIALALASPVADKPLALIRTYAHATDCDADNTAYTQLPIYAPDNCIALPNNTATLKVMHSDETKLRYNSRE